MPHFFGQPFYPFYPLIETMVGCGYIPRCLCYHSTIAYRSYGDISFINHVIDKQYACSVQLAVILPTEENFLLLFHRDNPLESSVEFMKVRSPALVRRKGFVKPAPAM